MVFENGTLNGMRTVQSTIGHRECNDHSLIPFCLIATYFYRIIRHFFIRLSLIVLCHTFITDNNRMPEHCYHIVHVYKP